MLKFSFEKVDAPKLDVYFQRYQQSSLATSVVDSAFKQALAYQISTLNLQSPYAWRIKKLVEKNADKLFTANERVKYLSKIRVLLSIHNFMKLLVENITDGRYGAIIDHFELTGKIERYYQLSSSLLKNYRLPKIISSMLSQQFGVVKFQIPRDNKEVVIIPSNMNDGSASMTDTQYGIKSIGDALATLSTMDEVTAAITSLFSEECSAIIDNGWLYAYEFCGISANVEGDVQDDVSSIDISAILNTIRVAVPSGSVKDFQNYFESHQSIFGTDAAMYRKLVDEVKVGKFTASNIKKALFGGDSTSTTELFDKLVTIPNVLIPRLENGRLLQLDVDWTTISGISVMNGVVLNNLSNSEGKVNDNLIANIPAWMASDFDSVYIHNKDYITDQLINEVLTQNNNVYGTRSNDRK